MKLRAKYFVRANLHLLNAVEPSHSHLKKETRILEMMVNQENLGRKLVVAQNLLSRQFSIQSRIQEVYLIISTLQYLLINYSRQETKPNNRNSHFYWTKILCRVI